MNVIQPFNIFTPKNEFLNIVSMCVNKLTLKKVNYLNDFIIMAIGLIPYSLNGVFLK